MSRAVSRGQDRRSSRLIAKEISAEWSRPYGVMVVERLILRLAGVLIWTSPERFSTMRRFYVDTLGLEPRSDRTHFVNFQLGAARLTIGVHQTVVASSKDSLRIMINLGVDDIEKAHERLVSEGVPCLRPPS